MMGISLRKFSETDLEDIYHLLNDKELCELANIPHAQSLEDLESLGFKSFKDGKKESHLYTDSEHVLQTIEFEGQICGTVSHHVDPQKKRIHDFQIILGRDFWYKKIGYNTLMSLMDEWKETGHERVRSEVLQGNRNSNNLMRHLGMDEIAIYEEGNKLFVRYELRLS
jgi:RimJ/RimL family protein N-acetyltransferase